MPTVTLTPESGKAAQVNVYNVYVGKVGRTSYLWHTTASVLCLSRCVQQ